jgi:hypothetical protein
MTTINIDKLLLEQVQDLLYRVTRWKGESHEVLTDLHDIKEAVKAVLAAPASAPEPVAWMSPKRFYRTRAMALINGEQLIEPLYLYPPATAPDEQVRRDAERVAWYENNPEKVLNIGFRWYSRNGYGLPMKRRKGFREAIDAAMKETP